MTQDTKFKITSKTIHLFALLGYEGVSMRTLAEAVGIAPSVLYHYYADKDLLLKAVFDETNLTLGAARAKLHKPLSAKTMLKQRIIFQIDHAEEIVFVLKYFLANRRHYKKFHSGYVPDKTTKHIEEVLHYGQQTGEFVIDDIALDAKVVTHAINGFILEYYPAKLKGKEKEALVNLIYNFLLRALAKGGEKYV